MRLVVQIPTSPGPAVPNGWGPDLARVAETVDPAGFDYLAVMDHFFQIEYVGPIENDMLDAYTTPDSSPRRRAPP